MLIGHNARSGKPVAFTLFVAIGVAIAQPVDAGTLEPGSSEPFGTFNHVEYIRHTGRFTGVTAKGAFRMPYEIVAPVLASQGNGTVLVEPPHNALGLVGRDGILGRRPLFDRGFSYATVGFGENGLNILEPDVTDLLIAGEPAIFNDRPFARDTEILVQFAEDLVSDPVATGILGQIQRRYAFGVSQTAGSGWHEAFYGPGAEGVFDFTLLFVTLWKPHFTVPDPADLPEEFVPLAGIGKVIFVASEGDQFISESVMLRRAVVGSQTHPNYRLYEVAGAPHFAVNPPFNPLDASLVARAAFIAGDEWVRLGTQPPPSLLMESSPPGVIDPTYKAVLGIDLVTGIARDDNGNARGGVRLPDVELGRALFIASVPDIEIVPGLPGIVGLWFDLACEPVPGSTGDQPRFRNHGDYVGAVAAQAEMLAAQRYLLPEDVGRLVSLAARSQVGRRGSCPTP
jgi:hypothetical protein